MAQTEDLDRLKALIARCDELMRPETMFTINDQYRLQQDSVNLFLLLGSEFDSISLKVEAIKFAPDVPSWALQDSALKEANRLPIVPTGWGWAKFNEYLAQQLNTLKTLLVVALERASRSTTLEPEPAGLKGQFANANPHSLSREDEWLHRLIGPEPIKNSTDAELWDQFGSTLRKRKRGYRLTAFRGRVDRIRRRYGYPASRQVKKKRLEKVREINQG